MNKYLTSVLMPPVGAIQYGCGTSCGAPVTVFWLFGLISIVFGLFGGPTGEPGISWKTILLGLATWAISAAWTLLTLHGADAEQRHGN
jgi:hypothetical protein